MDIGTEIGPKTCEAPFAQSVYKSTACQIALAVEDDPMKMNSVVRTVPEEIYRLICLQILIRNEAGFFTVIYFAFWIKLGFGPETRLLSYRMAIIGFELALDVGP